MIVVAAGWGVALAANRLSPRGLDLSRNYFPGATNTVVGAPIPASTNEPSPEEEISQRLRDKGLQEVKKSQALALFHDPRLQTGQIIFVDARDQDHFEDGHIPGAYELDPYHPEKGLNTVLPLCQAAEKVVVYCNGGDCEDADTTALLLRDGGVPAAKLFVYGGGFTEWQEAKLPIATGPRK